MYGAEAARLARGHLEPILPPPARMPLAGPGLEDQHHARVGARPHLAALALVEVRQVARPARLGLALLLDLDLAGGDEQPRRSCVRWSWSSSPSGRSMAMARLFELERRTCG
jgi:hypothetical protein